MLSHIFLAVYTISLCLTSSDLYCEEKRTQILKMDNNKKRKAIPLELKFEIINEVENGLDSKSEIARKHGLASSTLSTILKNKDSIKSNFERSLFQSSRKQFRSGEYTDIEEALFKWFTSARSAGVQITGPVLATKAESLAEKFGRINFKASNGFIERFKERRGIMYKNVCGESNAVDCEIVQSWKEKLPSLIEQYEPRNIFNADETGLFYKLQPDKFLHFKGESCSGRKKSKERITVILAANIGTDKLKPFLIGKFKNP